MKLVEVGLNLFPLRNVSAVEFSVVEENDGWDVRFDIYTTSDACHKQTISTHASKAVSEVRAEEALKKFKRWAISNDDSRAVYRVIK